MSMLVSILIPCYNGEAYISRCINSCIQQTYKNIEIIIINDGSTDKSLELLKKYEKQDKRIKVFTQLNQGLGETRNILISKANGEYFFFLDIDDLIPENAIENLVDASNNGKMNLVVGRSLIFFKKYFFPFVPSWWRVKEMTAEHYVKSNICTPWGQIIKTSFFKSLNVRFVKGEIFEDIGLMSYIFMKSSDNFHYIKSIVYKYQISKSKDKLSSFKDKCNIKLFSIYKQTENLLKLFDYDNMLKTKKERRFINGTFFQIFNSTTFVSNSLNRKSNMSFNVGVFQAIARFNIFSIINEFGFEKIKFSKTWWKSMSYFLIRIWYRKIFKNFSSKKQTETNATKFINKKIIKSNNKVILEHWSLNSKINNKKIYEIHINDLGIFVEQIKNGGKIPSKILLNIDVEDIYMFVNKYYYQIAKHQIIMGIKLSQFVDYDKILRYFSFVYSDDEDIIEWLNEHKLKTVVISNKVKNDFINFEVINENI